LKGRDFLRERKEKLPHIISGKETSFPYRTWKYVALRIILGELGWLSW